MGGDGRVPMLAYEIEHTAQHRTKLDACPIALATLSKELDHVVRKGALPRAAGAVLLRRGEFEDGAAGGAAVAGPDGVQQACRGRRVRAEGEGGR